MSPIRPNTFNQAEVERATGLSREVLRKWELRFQFPKPLRDSRNQRVYTAAEVVKLQYIQRLIARGHKPRHVVPLSLRSLKELTESGVGPQGGTLSDSQQFTQEFMAALSAATLPDPALPMLRMRLQQVGLDHFAQRDMPACNALIGEAWMTGQLRIHVEHRYTHAVQLLLQQHLSELQPAPTGANVLLTTPPGELHGLALLAFQAVLALRGAQCLNLGTQTPAEAVAEAVIDFNISVVCISASACSELESLRDYLCALRKQLPQQCALWVGGASVTALTRKPIQGVTLFKDVQSAIDQWSEHTT